MYDNYYASAGLVWDAYLINNFEDDSTAYFTEIPYGDITKSKRVNRSGRKGESTIAGGVNIDNKTYIGFSMGFPTVTFRESYTYTESGLDDELELLGYDFKEDLLVTGTGINLKAGVIIQAKEWLRLGAAYHIAGCVGATPRRASGL